MGGIEKSTWARGEGSEKSIGSHGLWIAPYSFNGFKAKNTPKFFYTDLRNMNLCENTIKYYFTVALLIALLKIESVIL